MGTGWGWSSASALQESAQVKKGFSPGSYNRTLVISVDIRNVERPFAVRLIQQGEGHESR
jgi:hypothetical protein